MRHHTTISILTASLLALTLSPDADAAAKKQKYQITLEPVSAGGEIPVKVPSIPTLNALYAPSQDSGGFAPEDRTLTLAPPRTREGRGSSSDDPFTGGQPQAPTGPTADITSLILIGDVTAEPADRRSSGRSEDGSAISPLEPGSGGADGPMSDDFTSIGAGDPDDGVDVMPIDCNGNGTPDGTEILADPGLDFDGNGRIDRCERNGDINYDGRIDIDDLVAMILDWGGCAGEDCYSDLNKDGVVNEEDASTLFVHWNWQ